MDVAPAVILIARGSRLPARHRQSRGQRIVRGERKDQLLADPVRRRRAGRAPLLPGREGVCWRGTADATCRPRKQGNPQSRSEGYPRRMAPSCTLFGGATPLHDAGGRVRGCIAGFIDITARKKAEESLRELSQAVEQSPVNVIITDLDGNIEYVNRRFTQVTGYTLAEVIGKNPRILKSGHTSDEEYRSLWRTITAGGEWSGEFLNKAKDGTLFWERALITSIKDEAGRITRFFSVKEDITEHKTGRRGVAADAAAIDPRRAAFDPRRNGGRTGPRAEPPAVRDPQLCQGLPKPVGGRGAARPGQLCANGTRRSPTSPRRPPKSSNACGRLRSAANRRAPPAASRRSSKRPWGCWPSRCGGPG